MRSLVSGRKPLSRFLRSWYAFPYLLTCLSVGHFWLVSAEFTKGLRSQQCLFVCLIKTLWKWVGPSIFISTHTFMKVKSDGRDMRELLSLADAEPQESRLCWSHCVWRDFLGQWTSSVAFMRSLFEAANWLFVVSNNNKSKSLGATTLRLFSHCWKARMV